MNRLTVPNRTRRITRRTSLQALLVASLLPAAWTLRAQSPSDVAELLRAGGCVLMLRHAQTDAGIGDPPNFQLNQCSTQRNLSKQGRAQAKRMAQWFAARELLASRVQSSAWCRCKDTAMLAFGRFDVLPDLNSTFDSSSGQATQTEALLARLRDIRAGQFEVWVTHQVNISSFTNEGPVMGEAFVVKPGTGSTPGRVLARTRFD